MAVCAKKYGEILEGIGFKNTFYSGKSITGNFDSTLIEWEHHGGQVPIRLAIIFNEECSDEEYTSVHMIAYYRVDGDWIRLNGMVFKGGNAEDPYETVGPYLAYKESNVNDVNVRQAIHGIRERLIKRKETRQDDNG